VAETYYFQFEGGHMPHGIKIAPNLMQNLHHCQKNYAKKALNAQKKDNSFYK
jgi:hypothetical protein